MTLSQFSSLTDQQRIDAICNKGVLVGKRVERNREYQLIQIDSFYVEVKYLSGDKNMLTFKIFKTTDLLDSYIDHIDISSLIVS